MPGRIPISVPGCTTTGTNDEVQVTGNLTLAGNLNIAALTGFGVGSYTLFTYGGTLTGSGFSGINGIAGYTVTVVTGVAHQVSLQGHCSRRRHAILGWFSRLTADGTILGGSGTWNNTSTNWTNAGGTANLAWQGGMAGFDATGGTVTLAAPINAQGLSFGSTGYTLSGGSALNLIGTKSGGRHRRSA